MLVNSEVAEGDLIEAFPIFTQRLAAFFAAALVMGSIGYLWSSGHVTYLLARMDTICLTIWDRLKA